MRQSKLVVDEDRLIAIVRTGASRKVIAEELGLNPKQVDYYMTKHNIRRETVGYKGNTYTTILNKNADQVVLSLLEHGKSHKEIAEEFGVTIGSLQRWISVMNFSYNELKKKPINEIFAICADLKKDPENSPWLKDPETKKPTNFSRKRRTRKASYSIAEIQQKAREKGMTYGKYVNSEYYKELIGGVENADE